jgi:catechol 2,3-dioxygenase-like lactoylglutathione lyase family enzyme
MRIGLVGIFVDDQDRAERFYNEVLGLRVKTSAAYGPGERWLTVVSPEEPDGVELVLHLTDEPARAFQAASRQAGRCCRCARRLCRRGRAAQGQGRGVRQGTGTDGLRRHGCGVRRHLRQPAKSPPGLSGATVMQSTRRPNHPSWVLRTCVLASGAGSDSAWTESPAPPGHTLLCLPPAAGG